jgi:hypothetical protein
MLTFIVRAPLKFSLTELDGVSHMLTMLFHLTDFESTVLALSE